MMHHIGSIDLDTGELLQGVPVWVGVTSSPYGNRWFMAHQEALLSIAKDRELTKEAYRILMVLLGRLDFQNWIYVQQKEICHELNLKKGNVSHSIHLLEQRRLFSLCVEAPAPTPARFASLPS
jgi:hypothetical protein